VPELMWMPKIKKTSWKVVLQDAFDQLIKEGHTEEEAKDILKQAFEKKE